MKRILFVISFFSVLVAAPIENKIMGKWKTMDDETNQAKSHVEIYEKDGKYFAKIVELLDPTKRNSLCEACQEKDDRKNQKIEGMEIVRHLEEVGDEYKHGKILDPKNGKEYNCKIWLDEKNNLKVRGYIGVFYRTQTWYKID